MSDVLTDIEVELVFFVERFASTNGAAPTKAQIEQRFTGLPEDWYETFSNNPLVQKSFINRGIVYPPAEDTFTPEQMHAAATMLDIYDRRSDEKKLRDLGITTRQWAQWLTDDRFASYLNDRGERMIANSVFEMHKGTLKGIRGGNIQAVKLGLEITGRYRPDQEAQVDVRRILHTFIEIMQKYVKDPIILHKIAMDLSSAATAESYASGLSNQMMSGAITQRQTVQGSIVSGLPVPQLEEVERE